MRILILAPYGRDAELICSLFRKRGLDCLSVSAPADLAREMEQGAGAIVLTEEVIRDVPAFRHLLKQVNSEPEWSDLPVIALMSSQGSRFLLMEHEAVLHSVNLTVIERPARSETIARAAMSALRARRRQYQVRDFLAERLKSQENLWRTQKLESIGILAGGIAHDFNNLLTGVIGNASLLASQLEEEHPFTAHVHEILKSAERAADLTQQLLAYSGQGKFSIENIDLSQLIKETAQLIRTSIPASVRLQVQLEEQIPPVAGDRVQIQQIVMNMIINAAEAICPDRPGSVRASTSSRYFAADELKRFSHQETLPPGTYVCLEVEDNGTGMSRETSSKIFDPFFTTKFTGRGLGLAAVHGIVRSHKGGLQVSSQLGQGTRFVVLLPASDGDRPIASARATPLQPGRGRILFVDDEDAVRKLGSAILEHLGYIVMVAENGIEALDALRAEPGIDLVILDLTMPVMSGAEALQWIKRIRPEIPVLLISGFSEGYTRGNLPGSDYAGFLQKPFTAAQLSGAVSQVARGSPDASLTER